MMLFTVVFSILCGVRTSADRPPRNGAITFQRSPSLDGWSDHDLVLQRPCHMSSSGCRSRMHVPGADARRQFGALPAARCGVGVCCRINRMGAVRTGDWGCLPPV